MIKLGRELAPGIVEARLFRTKAEAADVYKMLLADSTEGSPNSMNKYGRTVSGFRGRVFCEQLVERVVQPLAREFLDERMRLKKRPYAFIVDYSVDTQRGLNKHVDGPSAVTMNLCLGKKFEGGDLLLYGERGEPFRWKQRVGFAVIHRGHHEHRAEPITSGERHNLVLWCMARKTRA